MPLDRESKQELIKRIIKHSQTESNADLSDEERLAGRRKKKFLNTVLNRLKEGQSTDSNQ